MGSEKSSESKPYICFKCKKVIKDIVYLEAGDEDIFLCEKCAWGMK